VKNRRCNHETRPLISRWEKQKQIPPVNSRSRHRSCRGRHDNEITQEEEEEQRKKRTRPMNETRRKRVEPGPLFSGFVQKVLERKKNK